MLGYVDIIFKIEKKSKKRKINISRGNTRISILVYFVEFCHNRTRISVWVYFVEFCHNRFGFEYVLDNDKYVEINNIYNEYLTIKKLNLKQ
jgi:hypothetical protein